MPTRSSDMTDQESGKRELSMASKAAAPVETPEAAAEDVVETETPEAAAEDVAEASVEVDTDAVAEASVDTYEETLLDSRLRIDAIDDQILELVERRIEVAGVVLGAKHARRIDLRDKLRQGAMLDRLTAATETLNKHQVRELYELFIRLGVEHFRQTVIDGRRGR